MLQPSAGREASPGGGIVRYERHCPERTLLYQLVEDYYPALQAQLLVQATWFVEANPLFLGRAAIARRSGDQVSDRTTPTSPAAEGQRRDNGGLVLGKSISRR